MADYRKMARRAAERHGLDPGVFERQIQQESSFNPHARSPAGAEGIAQIMPQTAKGWGVDPSNPRQALDAAAKNMASYVKRYGSYENALRAYNAGPGAIQASKGFAETNNYVKTILGGRSPSTKGVGKKVAGALGGGGGGRSTTTTTTTTESLSPATVVAALSQSDQQAMRPPVSVRGLPESLTPGGYTPIATTGPTEHSNNSDLSSQLADLMDRTTVETGVKSTTKPVRQADTTGAKGEPNVKGSQIKELIFNDGGKGYGIKNGQTVDGPQFYSGVWAGHANHVHVAAGPRTTRELGRVAQKKFGLHVGENPAFGGVSPVHVKDSYHYKGEAIDVSGDKAKMAAFARYVKRYAQSR